MSKQTRKSTPLTTNQVESPSRFITNSHQMVTANAGPMTRHEILEGRNYLVVPMVMLTEGVHAGSNGPLYYPRNELQKTPAVWNHKPVVVYHPTQNGSAVSACEPAVISRRKVGLIMNTRFEPGKGRAPGRLKAEAWLETNALKRVDERVLNAVQKKQMMEVSTGLFTDNEQVNGTWNGEGYTAIARNYRADHLAILPDEKGACSLADGAGLMRNSAGDAGGTEMADTDQGDQSDQDTQEDEEDPEKKKQGTGGDVGDAGMGTQNALTNNITEPDIDKLQSQLEAHEEEGRKVSLVKRGGSKSSVEMLPHGGTISSDSGAKHYAVAYSVGKDEVGLPVWRHHTGFEISSGQYRTLQKRGYGTGELAGKPVSRPSDDFYDSPTKNDDNGNPAQVIQGKPQATNLHVKIAEAIKNSPTLPSGVPLPGDVPWVKDVYPTFAIFQWKGKTYSQPYCVDEDDGSSVHMTGKPIETKTTTPPTFTTITGKVLNTRQEPPMTKNQIVNALIANRRTQWIEKDRAVLNTMDADVLQKMLPVRNDGGATPFPMTGPSGKTNSPNMVTSDGHDADNGETVEDQANAVRPGGARRKPPQLDAMGNPMGHDYDTDNPSDEEERMGPNPNGTQNRAATVEEYISAAPPEFQDLLTNSYQAYNTQKRQAIRQLTANGRCRFTPEFLATKSLQELQVLNELAGTKPQRQQASMVNNYAGMGDTAGEQAPITEEALGVPVLNFAKREE